MSTALGRHVAQASSDAEQLLRVEAAALPDLGRGGIAAVARGQAGHAHASLVQRFEEALGEQVGVDVDSQRSAAQFEGSCGA